MEGLKLVHRIHKAIQFDLNYILHFCFRLTEWTGSNIRASCNVDLCMPCILFVLRFLIFMSLPRTSLKKEKQWANKDAFPFFQHGMSWENACLMFHHQLLHSCLFTWWFDSNSTLIICFDVISWEWVWFLCMAETIGATIFIGWGVNFPQSNWFDFWTQDEAEFEWQPLF